MFQTPFRLKSFALNDSSKQVMLALLSMALFAPGCVYLCLEHKSDVLFCGGAENTPKKRAGLEDHPRICKWLVTSIYKPRKPFGRGTTAVGVVNPWQLWGYNPSFSFIKFILFLTPFISNRDQTCSKG